MAVNYGTRIISDGLVMFTDAANPRSYPGSGTTWLDLSPGRWTGTLQGSPTYSSNNLGFFTLNGTTQFVSTNTNISMTTGTLIAWIWRNGAQDAYDGILYSRVASTVSIAGLSTFSDPTVLSYTWNNSAATFNWNTGLTIPNQAWSMVAVSVGSATSTAYVNLSRNSQSFVPSAMTLTSGFAIGRDTEGTGRFFNGRISVAMVYNRALSDSEMETNFNALRGRYGI